MNERSYLYLWAITPPSPVTMQIDALRKEFSENFHCYTALKPPVHLTLYTLFKLPIHVVTNQMDNFGRWIGAQPSFDLELKNYSFFENPQSPVVFIDVLPNPALKELNKGLRQITTRLFDLENDKKTAFHPHFTIGYKDVSPEIFPAVKKAYSKRLFSAAFPVSYISLFKHSGIKWELQHILPLGLNSGRQGSLW